MFTRALLLTSRKCTHSSQNLIKINFQRHRAFISTERLYSKEHEWITYEKNDQIICRVGITDYAQRALGDVVFVETPDIGSTISKTGIYSSRIEIPGKFPY